MSNVSILDLILEVKPPFEVVKRTVSHNQKRIDVWISTKVSLANSDAPAKSGWFGFRKASVKAEQPRTEIDFSTFNSWRHLDLCGWQTFVHTPNPTPDAMLNQPWTGNVGQHFSHSLSRIIFGMFSEGASLAVICASLKINLTDLFKYKFALDKGQIGVLPQGEDASKKNAISNELISGVGSNLVPSVDHPVWSEIAGGAIEIDLKTLSLRLLLTKVKSQYRMAVDDEVRSLHIRDLHRYFEKNYRTLSHEIAQISLKK